MRNPATHPGSALKRHLICTAIGWGGNPRSAADYQTFYPPKNDGKIVYRLMLKDVPVDGFWSISVCNEKGYFQKTRSAPIRSTT